MALFFPDYDSLHRFSIRGDLKRDLLVCQHCNKSGHFVSHGFVYKQISFDSRITVGKRILCSNRNQHSGCGRTTRLYLDEFIPALHYSTKHLLAFLLALITGASILNAYRNTTGANNHRNASRWLDKLLLQLPTFRSLLQRYDPKPAHDHSTRNHRLQLILNTVQRLFSSINNNSPCQCFQLRFQTPFL